MRFVHCSAQYHCHSTRWFRKSSTKGNVLAVTPHSCKCQPLGSTIKVIIDAVVLGILIFSPSTGNAFTYVPSKAEWNTWPEYCRAQYVTTMKSEETVYRTMVPPSVTEKWKRILGRFFVHLHHYCHAIVELRNGLYHTDENQRRNYLRGALSDGVYALNRVKPNNPLYPDVVALVARTFYAMGDTARAIEVIEEGKKKSDMGLRIYIAEAEIWYKKGEYSKAKKVLDNVASGLTKYSAEYNYLYGLICYRLGDLGCAEKKAKKAYSLGYPLKGLKKLLSGKDGIE